MFNKDKKEKRFVVKESQSIGFTVIEIIIDTATGVNYIVTHSGVGGITPLLDENGNVVVSKIDEN